MKIQWYAHACFRLETADFSLVTDPYTPEKSGFLPVTEPADLVVRSSHDDSAHANAGMFPGADVMTMTRVPGEGNAWLDLRFRPIPAQESMLHKVEPKDNALFRFQADGLDIVHFGDVGNPIEPWQVDLMKGCDIVMVPTGGPPTIELADLHNALAAIKPRVTIPMHYELPGCIFPTMTEVDVFAAGYPEARIRRFTEPVITVTPADLPDEPELWILSATHTSA